ncbi:unnamed protein product [Heterobilharzia americana]|nr:unnamed protein product [Heterobilharzia americana]
MTENTENCGSSACTSLNKILSVQSSTRPYNWKYPLTAERNWLELEFLLHSATCLHLDEQQMLVSMLNKLPQSYRELVSRYISALNQTINLSGYSWDTSARFRRLVELGERIANYLRPPWFFYCSREVGLTETNQAHLIRNATNLMQKYQEIQNQFLQLCNLLQPTNIEDIFRLLSHMLSNLIEFVKHSYANVEAVYNNVLKLVGDEMSPTPYDWSIHFHYFTEVHFITS